MPQPKKSEPKQNLLDEWMTEPKNRKRPTKIQELTKDIPQISVSKSTPAKGIRLNKILAERGVCSRRAADDLIATGRVRVNGEVADIGMRADPKNDEIVVDSETLEREQAKLVYFAMNKPAGYTTSSRKTRNDPQIVLDLLPRELPRLFPVGRLDKQTTGLLLFTNDGLLTDKLIHPSRDCEKEYEAELSEPLTAERVKKIEAGVPLEREKTKPVKIQILGPKRARVVLTEGKNRQVRKIFGKVGCEVVKLKRVRIKNLELGNLKEGQIRELTAVEVANLKDL